MDQYVNHILFTGDVYQVDTVNDDGTITVSNEKHTITILDGDYKVLSKQESEILKIKD